MFIVTEKVFEDETLVHESRQEWKLKSQFLNKFRKVPGVSSWAIGDLSKKNRTEIEADGLRRVIEIEPVLQLEVASNG